MNIRKKKTILLLGPAQSNKLIKKFNIKWNDKIIKIINKRI